MPALGADLPIDHSQVFTRIVVRQAFEVRATAVNSARPPDIFIALADSREQMVFVCGRKAWIDADIGWSRYPELLLDERAWPANSHSHALDAVVPAPQRPDRISKLAFAAAGQMRFGNRRKLFEAGRQFVSHRKLNKLF